MADKRCRRAGVDTDPPGLTHADLCVDRCGETDDRHHDSGELNRRCMQDIQRRHHARQLQNGRDDEARSGEPLRRTDARVTPRARRTGPTMLQPTAPTEPQHSEDGEQCEGDDGHGPFFL